MAIGKLLETNYLSDKFSTIIDITDFYKTALPEMKTVKSLYTAIKQLYNTTNDRILFQCAEGKRIYKYIVLSKDIHKYPVGWFIYIPEKKRLDFYTEEEPSLPFIQWYNKKPVWKNYPAALDRAGLDKIFTGIINSLN